MIPVSDEGPKDGDPSQQADDKAAIQEAHDNCLLAGVVPVGLYGQGYGGAGNIQSHFMDLVQCPNGIVSTQTRNCPGNTLANTDAGGQAYEFPSGTGNNQMALLVEAMVYISTNNSREIYMSVLDPYAKMNNDPSFTPGLPATLLKAAITRGHRPGFRRSPGCGERHPHHHRRRLLVPSVHRR